MGIFSPKSLTTNQARDHHPPVGDDHQGAPKTKSRKWWWMGGIVAAFVMGLAIGASPPPEEAEQEAVQQPTATAAVVATSARPPAGASTATQQPTATGAVVATTPAPTPTETPAATPEPTLVNVVIRDVQHTEWEDWLGRVLIHFVVRIENTGNVPAEVRNIHYKMRDAAGALVEQGGVPHSFPRKLAPGQIGVIGRTVSADTARGPSDIAQVQVVFDVSKTGKPDNLLEVASVDRPSSDDGGAVSVSGTVRNTSDDTYDDVAIAVVLSDADGNWVGYATAELPANELPAGELARFVTDTDLPAEALPPIASVEVIAFDK